MNKKKFFIRIVKILAAGLSLWMIYQSVFSKDSFSQSVEQLREVIRMEQIEWMIAVVVILMILNWMSEALKWKWLAGKVVSISYCDALYAVLTGVTVSFFTPNRVGEFAGKVIHLPFQYRIRGSVASVVGSLNQLLITLVAGGISVLVLIRSALAAEKFYFSLIAGFTIIAVIMLTMLYFNIGKVYRWLHEIEWLKKVDEYVEVLSFYSLNDLWRVTLLSVFRYAVFTLQYILLLHLFGIQFGWFYEAATVSAIFLVMTVVPGFAFTEVLTRSSVAIYFLSPYASSAEPVVAASFFLWLINLAIPSVFGALTLLKVKLTRE